MEHLMREYTFEGYLDRNNKPIRTLFATYTSESKINDRINKLVNFDPYRFIQLFVRQNENENWQKIYEGAIKNYENN